MKKNAITAKGSIAIEWNKLREVSAKCSDVIPCVVQDNATKKVLLLAYVNEAALRQSLRTGVATFWSTSRNELWVKGATSGSILQLAEIRINCELNSLLYLVTSAQGACHTKNKRGEYRQSCFYRRIEDDSLVSIDDEKEEKKS